MPRARLLLTIAPGLGLCSLIVILILGVISQIPETIFDTLLIALLAGIGFKTLFPHAHWHDAGTKFASRFILEFSVMILGASIVLADVASAGSGLFMLIVVGVCGGMLVAFIVGHVLMKLSLNLSILIGVSNSICGNSAAVVIAPIIGASSLELTAALGISSLLGAIQIILLPLLVPAFGLTDYHYGVVAGMAVYAVAQVYAASATVSTVSASVATFVKLVRVVMLVPIVILIQLAIDVKEKKASTKQLAMELDAGGTRSTVRTIGLFHYVPWFVFGFIVLAILRSAGIINEADGDQAREFSRHLFLVAMVAIGIGVNLRDIVQVGPKVIVAILSVVFFMITISILFGSLLDVEM